MNNNTAKLKRVVIKEEMVALTGDWLSALILNQFLYWSERVRDFDKFIKEEKARANDEVKIEIELQHGWIYKTADELGSELMVGVSSSTIRRRIKELVSAGWLNERRNPIYKWDRTLQYRPDIRKITLDLQAIGYALAGYPLVLTDAICTVTDGNGGVTDQSEQDAGTIPEITTETTTDTNSSRDFLQDVTDFDQELFGDAHDRPVGWRACDEKEYAVCGRVAHHWRSGILPRQTKFIEDGIVGAAELLAMHSGDLRQTLLTIDEYHQEYQDAGRDFTVAGPQSLVNEIPAFLSRQKQDSSQSSPKYKIVPRELDEDDAKQDKGNDQTVGEPEPQGAFDGAGRPRRAVPAARRFRP